MLTDVVRLTVLRLECDLEFLRIRLSRLLLKTVSQHFVIFH
jgi:hypothetical protein